MHLRHLSLVDFRNYAEADVALGTGPTVFVGPNGQGKTNLVEAAYYVATQSSHRVSAAAPLVRIGCERAVVRAAVEHDGRQLQIELEITPGKAGRARLNRAPLRRAREALGVLRAVLFAPEDLAIVRGDPGGRREFLDDLLVARSPRYAAVRSDLDRLLKQRNALLKSALGGRRTVDLSILDVWDGHIAQTAGALLAGRLALVRDLRPHLELAYDTVSSRAGPATMAYAPSVDVGGATAPADLAETIRTALAAARPRELERGTTLVGPHRDELELAIGALPLRGYASHGEGWSYALALRLAAYQLLATEGPQPVLILDDVFAELDTTRRARLAEIAAAATQVLITAAVADDVPARLRGTAYTVTGGSVHRA